VGVLLTRIRFITLFVCALMFASLLPAYAQQSPTPEPAPSDTGEPPSVSPSPSNSAPSKASRRSALPTGTSSSTVKSLNTPGNMRHYTVSSGVGSRNATSTGEVFVDVTLEVYFAPGDVAYLAGSNDALQPTVVDDAAVVNGTEYKYHSSCSGSNTAQIKNVTAALTPGIHDVHVQLKDVCGGQISSAMVFLVVGGSENFTHLTTGACTDTDIALNPSTCGGDPVNTATGSFVTSTTDAALPGIGMPFELKRTYASSSDKVGRLGRGWKDNLDVSLKTFGNGDVMVRGGTGQELLYPKDTCGFSSPPGSTARLTAQRAAPPDYEQIVMGDGPVAYWRLGEASGTTANDETTNNLDGTYNGGPTLGASGVTQDDTAVHLDGVNDYINVPNASALNPTNVSVEAWVKSTGTTWNDYAWVAAKRDQYILHPWPGGTLIRFYVNVAGGWYYTGFSPSSIQGWHHYVGTYNGTGALNLYIDGDLVSTANINGSIGSGSGNALHIGGDLVGATRYGAGDMDEVAIYNRALSASEVEEHFDSANSCPAATGYTLTRKDGSKLSFNTAGKLTSIEDRNGNDLSLTYTAGKLTGVTDTAGRTVDISYNNDDRISLIELEDGREVSYGYTGDRLTSVTDVRGGTTTYGYDTNLRMTSITDQNGHDVVTNVYGTDGRVLGQTDAEGHETDYSWNATTQTATITDSRGKEWKDVYDDGVLVQQIDPLNNTTTYERNADLDLIGITDARGNEISMSYDSRHNLLSRTAPAPLGYVESFTYNANDTLASHTNGRGYTTSYFYDSAGNLTGVTRPGSVTTTLTRSTSNPALVTAVTDPRSKVTAFDHDTDGNVAEITAPGGGVTTLTYDGAGRITSVVDPRGNESGEDPEDFDTLLTYDAANHLVTQTDPLGNTTEWTYALDGRLLSKEDPNNHVTAYGYDENHRLLTVTAPDESVTTYAYDLVGNLTSRTDAEEHETTYAYDDANRLLSVTSPTGQTWGYSYDANGNLTQVVDAAGNATTGDSTDGKTIMAYDVLNRLTSVGYSDATPDVTFSYDANSNRIQMTDGFGTEGYAYDTLDRLTKVFRGTQRFKYEYSAGSQVTKRTYPDGTVVDYTYDDDGRIASVTSAGNETDYTYDPAGRLATTTLPTGNGHTETRSYDPAGRLTELVNADGSNVLSEALYTYDAAANPMSLETLAGATTFDYDEQDRLTEACFPPGCGVTGEDYVRYTYDGVGNRLTEARPSSTTTSTYNDSDQILSSVTGSTTTTFTHDDNGNLTGDGTRTFAYDLAGRMTSSTTGTATTTYEYDGDGKRLRTVDGSTTKFLWDPNGALPMLASEREGTAMPRRYVNGNDAISMTAGGSSSQVEADRCDYAPVVTDDSARAYWRLSETSGTTAQDATSSNIDGTYQNSPTLSQQGMAGATGDVAVSFDGTNDRVDVYDAADPTAYTLEAWVKFDSTSNQSIIARSDGNGPTGANSHQLRIENSKFVHYVYDGSLKFVTGSTTVQTGVWYHVVGTAANSGMMRLYVNGVEEGTAQSLGGMWTGGDRWFFAANSGGMNHLDGTLDEVALYSTALSATRIQAHYDCGKAPEMIEAVSGGDPFYFHRDGLGSITDVTDGAGAAQWSYAYEPFGAFRDATQVATGAPANSIGFTGQYLDPTGLYHLRARQYAPGIGRFTSVDPWTQSTTNPYVSSYLYANARPGVFVDPLGLFVLGVCASVQIGFGPVHFQANGCLVGSSNWQLGVTGTVGAGVSTGAEATAGAGLLYSDAGGLGDLRKAFHSVGVSAGEVLVGGAEYFTGQGHCGQDVSGTMATIGGGVQGSLPVMPWEGHAGETWTGVHQLAGPPDRPCLGGVSK
jgi:RHS repeat-associated protein